MILIDLGYVVLVLFFDFLYFFYFFFNDTATTEIYTLSLHDALPILDAISEDTLHYSENGGEAVGGFTWSLHFTWHQTFQREMQRRHSLADYIRFVWRRPD